MTKKEYWDLFKETGKIEYYLKYKNIIMEDGLYDKKNRGNNNK